MELRVGLTNGRKRADVKIRLDDPEARIGTCARDSKQDFWRAFRTRRRWEEKSTLWVVD
jgi:hypothetical protein